MAAGYANFPPLCQVMVAMPRVGLGRSFYGSYRKLWRSLCPPNGSGPGISQPIFMLSKYLALFPMPSGRLTRAANVPKAQTRGGIGTLWYSSLVYATPCARNKNGTCHLQLMALLMALTPNYVNRYAHQMGQSLPKTSTTRFGPMAGLVGCVFDLIFFILDSPVLGLKRTRY